MAATHLWWCTCLQSVQPVYHIGHVPLQPHQSCSYLLIDICPSSTAALWHTAGGIYAGTQPRTTGRPRCLRSWKEILMSASARYNFGTNKRGLLRLTSSSAWQGAVKLTRIHPIFKEGISHDHLSLSSTSGTAAIKPKIRLSDWVSSWSGWQNFWWRPPLRRTTVTIINEQQLTNS